MPEEEKMPLVTMPALALWGYMVRCTAAVKSRSQMMRKRKSLRKKSQLRRKWELMNRQKRKTG